MGFARGLISVMLAGVFSWSVPHWSLGAEAAPDRGGGGAPGKLLSNLLDNPTELRDHHKFKKALGYASRITDKSLVPRLTKSLNASDPRVRAVAVRGLWALADKGSATALREYLTLHDPVMIADMIEEFDEQAGEVDDDLLAELLAARFAIDALGALGDWESLPTLRRLARTQAWGRQATDAVVRIDGVRPLLEPKEMTEEEQEHFGNSVAKLSQTDETANLQKMLLSKGVSVPLRRGAAIALGRIKATGALGGLIQIAKDKKSDAELRAACAFAAAQMRGAALLDLYRELLRGDEELFLKQELSRQLGSLKIPVTLGLFMDLLKDDDQSVRYYAANAVAELSGRPFEVMATEQAVTLRWNPDPKLFDKGKEVTFTGLEALLIRSALANKGRLKPDDGAQDDRR